MIKPIYRILRNQLTKMYQERLEESKYNEDRDYEPIRDYLETHPVSTDEQELAEYIRNATITRHIHYIVIHCTATSTSATVTAIRNYWRNTLKWKNPGYHIIFHHDDGFTVLADFDNVTNGVRGFNFNSIHLSYIGGIDAQNKPIDNRSENQKKLIKIAVEELKKRLPEAIVQGHRDFPGVAKACPCFDAKSEYESIV